MQQSSDLGMYIALAIIWFIMVAIVVLFIIFLKNRIKRRNRLEDALSTFLESHAKDKENEKN